MKHSLLLMILSLNLNVFAQKGSVAKQWVDQVLFAVKWDGQGPTIQARNLYHASMAMYEAWAFYTPKANQVFLGKDNGGFKCEFNSDFQIPKMNIDSAINIAVSHAVYTLVFKRYSEYSSKNRGTIEGFDDLMDSLLTDRHFKGIDYESGSPSALGNYIGEKIYEFGLQDGAHEEDNYESRTYETVNGVLKPEIYGSNNPDSINRWQPISIRGYLNNKGEDKTLPQWYKRVTSFPDIFLTPEWGEVTPFALPSKTVKSRNGKMFNLYLDPGSPPRLDYQKDGDLSELYKWGFVMNIIWSSHMDPADQVKMDISPKHRFGFPEFPKSFKDYQKFYDYEQGGSVNVGGKKMNPKTGKEYENNIVLRGDYARVIAEYWVDGIFTYSPPGHWFQHLTEVSYTKDFKRKWKGRGEELSELEWDIRSYFTLGGAMHDAGIASWAAKGFYDYVRPISAIRIMAGFGQCSDSSRSNYDKRGLPLIKGHIEIVEEGDSLAGINGENVGLIKLYTWKGPDYIDDAKKDKAGVGWILSGNWWPYQRYSFVTPPFAGYVSGHSTFSTCGAEVLTQITGDPYFPHGLKEMTFKKNSFLEFEKGPSTDITLQWATYHDAANETCLSRIWGGIHPPADDIPGRLMGMKIAELSVNKASGLIK